MAKRKHSTALFEVITKSNQYARPKPAAYKRTSLLAVARRWFTRPDTTLPPVARVVEPTILPLPIQVTSEPQPQPEPQAEIETASEYPDLDAGPRPQNLAVAVDPERRQIALRMSYTVAIVGGFAVVVIVALSIIVGQHLKHSGVPLLAQTTTDELRKGPAHREVLDPPRRVNVAGIQDLTVVPPNNRPAGNGAADNRPAGPTASPPTVAGDGKRYISMNYAIIQSYPETERKMAEEACAFLNREGVACTVETGVKGYLAISVVGLQGFVKQSTPEYKSYVQHIQQLSAKYTGNNRSYKAFAPVPKKWDKQD